MVDEKDRRRLQCLFALGSTEETRRRSTFCETAGLDYVSCSPFRIPVARLAAAQAALKAHTTYVPAGG
jgi:hypothetical protein